MRSVPFEKCINTNCTALGTSLISGAAQGCWVTTKQPSDLPSEKVRLIAHIATATGSGPKPLASVAGLADPAASNEDPLHLLESVAALAEPAATTEGDISSKKEEVCGAVRMQGGGLQKDV